MDKEIRNFILVIVIAIAVMSGAYFGIEHASGVDPTYTTVESQSMQHSNSSQIGIIDTGDMVLLKNKEYVTIQSYVEGYISGYSHFGEYGDVIIYDRGSTMNPVIHRAILWLDYNGDGTWSAPSLEKYPSDLWSCTNGTNYNNLSGTFTMYDVGYSSKTVSINLDSLEETSGYLTMGDNKANYTFDQNGVSGAIGQLITFERINSVAWIEIPFAGVFNMIFHGKINVINTQVPNAIPCITMIFLTIIFSFIALNFYMDYREFEKYYKEKIKTTK